MKKVVTLGEIMLRLSTNTGERLFQANQLTMNYGGAEANVAVSLSQLGFQAYFISKIPNNSLGTAVVRHLKANGVDTTYLLKGGERLGTYYLESGVGERSAQVTYDRKYSSFSNLTKEELDWDEIFKGAKLFHITGITLALSSHLRELAFFAIKKAKEFGVITSFDFNYRASLWSQKEASIVFKELMCEIDICFCGELDAIYLLGIEIDETMKLEDYYKKIKERYPNIFYMASTTRQVHSATSNTLQGHFYMDGKLYQSKAHQIEPIIDRVGGGDAFAAGVLYGILEGLSPEQLITFATAASALKHTVHGDCNPFSVEEISTFIKNGSGKILR